MADMSIDPGPGQGDAVHPPLFEGGDQVSLGRGGLHVCPVSFSGPA